MTTHNVWSNSPYIEAITGGKTTVYKAGDMNVGHVRYNTNTQSLEVYDGAGYVKLADTYTEIKLTRETEQLLEYVRQQRDKEQELERLAQDNVAIKNLLVQIKEKESQLEMVYKLIKNYKEDDSWSL